MTFDIKGLIFNGKGVISYVWPQINIFLSIWIVFCELMKAKGCNSKVNESSRPYGSSRNQERLTFIPLSIRVNDLLCRFTS